MPRTPKRTAPKAGPPGVISGNELYRLDELLARLDLGEDGWRQLRRRGLESAVVRIAGHAYVHGSDVAHFFRALRLRAAEAHTKDGTADGKASPA